MRGGTETVQYHTSHLSNLPAAVLSVFPPVSVCTVVLFLLMSFLWCSDSSSERALVTQRSLCVLLCYSWLKHSLWSSREVWCQAQQRSEAAFFCLPAMGENGLLWRALLTISNTLSVSGGLSTAVGYPLETVKVPTCWTFISWLQAENKQALLLSSSLLEN